jgi:TolB-like protein
MGPVVASVILVTALFAGAARAAEPARPTITVAPFGDETNKAALAPLGLTPLSLSLADMLLNDIAAATNLQVAAPGQSAGAAYVLTGTIRAVAPELRIDVRLVRSGDHGVVRQAPVAGRQARFFALETALVTTVVDVLGDLLAAGDGDRIKQAVRGNHPDRFAAALTYGKGLQARDAGDLETAARHLQQVVASEPAFTLAKSRCNDVVTAVYRTGGHVPVPPKATRRPPAH